MHKFVVRVIHFAIFVYLFAAMGRADAPSIESRLKPEVYRNISAQRGLHSNAALETLDPSLNPPFMGYRFYSVMNSSGTLRQAHRAFTDFAAYHRFLPFVKKTQFDPATQILKLEGGVWDFVLQSQIRLTRVSDRWIEFEAIEGHFRGLKGELVIEPRSPRGILVLFRGEVRGQGNFPPRFIMERAAEFVLDLSAKKMRSVIENDE